jgi:hypothetical protein
LPGLDSWPLASVDPGGGDFAVSQDGDEISPKYPNLTTKNQKLTCTRLMMLHLVKRMEVS